MEEGVLPEFDTQEEKTGTCREPSEPGLRHNAHDPIDLSSLFFLHLSIYLSMFFIISLSFCLSALSLFISLLFFSRVIVSFSLPFLVHLFFFIFIGSVSFLPFSHLSLPRSFYHFYSSILPCLFIPCYPPFHLLFLFLSLSIFLSIHPSAVSSFLFLSVNISPSTNVSFPSTFSLSSFPFLPLSFCLSLK